MGLQYFDLHSHVSFKDFDDDREQVIARMHEQGVGTITVGVDIQTSHEAVAFVENKDGFYATVGLHPNDTPEERFDWAAFSKLAAHPKVVGVGECGIDYFRIVGDEVAEKKRQWEQFELQVDFAIQHDLPLMIHCRPRKGTVDAYEEVASYLEERSRASSKLRGNMHFFVGNVDVARRFYTIGFTTSYTGVLTFTHDYDEVVRFAPLDMLLTETDAPYAAPAPFRGKRNEPSYVTHVVKAIAAIRGADEEGVRAEILENSKRMFGVV